MRHLLTITATREGRKEKPIVFWSVATGGLPVDGTTLMSIQTGLTRHSASLKKGRHDSGDSG